MDTTWTPRLDLRESAGRCRLSLASQVHGHGPTLQDAADDLVARLVQPALASRGSGFPFSSERVPDRRWLEFVWEIGELAARGEDVRERVLGPQSAAA